MTQKQLSLKQERFCLEYLRDGNATAAYIRAGYARRGANGHAARLVANGSIQARLMVLREHIASHGVLTAADIVRRLQEIAYFNAGDVVNVRRAPCAECRALWAEGRAGAFTGRRLLPHPDCPTCDGEGRPILSFVRDEKGHVPLGPAVSAVEVQGDRLNIRFDRKLKALTLLARIFGLFRCKHCGR